MKRPIEEEEGTDDKSPNKKKKKLQKKCKFSFSSRCVRLSGHGRTICAQVGAEETHLGDQMWSSAVSEIMKCAAIDDVTQICSFLFELN